MNKKKILILLVSLALLAGVFGVAAVNITSSTMAEGKTEAALGQENAKSDTSSSSAEKEAAEELIGETLSRKKIKKSVGEWDKFEMSSNGCERGVFAGKFYYKDFTIFSRTYDKGKTFSIVSVN